MKNNECPEFPFFGATYPDATCIDGYLYDLDYCDSDGNLYNPIETIPCPFCNTEKFLVDYGHDTYFKIIMRYGDKMKLSINDEYFEKVLTEVGFYKEDNPFPKSQFGLISFLFSKNIKLVPFKCNKGWQYNGMDMDYNDDFTEDLMYYESFDECVNTGIIECFCYLATKMRD